MKLHSAAAAMLLLAGPAMAQDDVAFKSPTGNIHCAIFTWEEGTEARCDLIELTPSYTKAPAGCDLDWGFAFLVADEGKGFLGCVGDTTIGQGNPVLPYGEAVSLGGISCVSAKTGMTCTNAEGHGFSVSKASQRLF
ncbi:MAG: hypothetical protein JNN02_05240 [Tabrizicola sp.]|nr:hypothetical protein [Tabrizicola sp.]HMS96501.1 hypothetical protein [Tabrizicola sp.]